MIKIESSCVIEIFENYQCLWVIDKITVVTITE